MTVEEQRVAIRDGLKDLILKFQEESPDAGYGYEPAVWVPRILAFLEAHRVVLVPEDTIAHGVENLVD